MTHIGGCASPWIMKNDRCDLLTLVLNSEAVDCCLGVGLAGFEECGGEVGLIWRVGEVLRLEAEAGEAVELEVSTAVGAVEVIGSIELEAWFCCEELECASAARVVGFGGWSEDAFGAVDDEVVVVAVFELVDAVADLVREDEIESCVLDALDLSCWDVSVVAEGVFGGVHGDLCWEDVARSGEVEVGVVGEVEDGLLVGLGLVVNGELVIVFEAEGDGDGEGAWVSVFHVWADVLHLDACTAFAVERLRVPNLGVERARAAVEVVGTVVYLEFVGLVVDGELAVGDAVGVASDGCAEEESVAEVFGGEVSHWVVEAEDRLAGFAVLVGRDDAGDCCADVGDLDGHSVVVGEREEEDVFAVDGSYFGLYCFHGEIFVCVI